MRRLIWGALWGAVVLAGCRTDSTVAMRSGSGSEGNIAKNPWSFERGFSLKGTVTAEYSDVLVIEDKDGKTRYLRITEQTRYYQGGKQTGREFLAPGSTVRASFANQDTEMIARDIVVVKDVGKADPLQVPDRTNTVP
ncbi:hypothetical protein [Archangium sp.]|uniref:hypothetical protein n=1 Tax=Archangium sp. TaxID=1872627 RepID=UPI00389A3399